MAQVLKRRRLANAGRRRRMSNKQIRYFGTKRQRNALRNRGRRRRHNQGGGGIVSQAEHAAERAIHTVEQAAEDAIGAVTRQVNRGGRRRNVGEILTVIPGNPGRRRNRKVAARARNRRRARNRARTSNYRRRNRRMNRGHRRRHNSPRVVVRYRNRRHNRRHNRRRNQGGIGGGFLQGDAGKVIGVLGGALLTSMVTGFLPSNLTGGTVGWITTGITAVVLGQVAGRALKNRSLGTFITVGGLLIVGLQLMNQFFPTLSLPFTTAGHSGMGLLTSSNFFVPQVNLPGSMASFVSPAAIPAPAVVPASTLRGLGQGASPLVGLRSARRMGRLR